MNSITSSLRADPKLSKSQLAFRINLARKRLSQYPLHKLDFILMDLERPDNSHRHADWCVGDLTGRVLEFLSCAEGIDNETDPRLLELFERILRTRRPSGLFGRYAQQSSCCKDEPEQHLMSGCHRLFNGLLKYFEYTNDSRALEAAVGLGDWFVRNKDEWKKLYGSHPDCGIHYWITEPLANLYRWTGDQKYLDMAAMIVEPIKRIEANHTHGLLTTMRGLQMAAIHTGDASWNEKPEQLRNTIIEQYYEMPDGCMPEVMLTSRIGRNEGCAIADWLMLNLNSGLISGQADAYTRAENILWNALFFNQFITGSFGHRDLSPHGYMMGPISECWWCCAENGGMAMTEYSRHAVTLRGNTLWINLLVPGTYQINQPRGVPITAIISTTYPSSATALIRVNNLPDGIKVSVRTPTCIKNPHIEERQTDAGIEINLTGQIGHMLESYQDKVIVKYGPTILAPMIYQWNAQPFEVGQAPAGYIPPNSPPGLPRIVAPEINSDGFSAFSSEPIPEWSYFETGPDAELSVEGASVYVDLLFDNGQKEKRWFSPMCHLTSNMTYMETPIIFKK